MSKDSITLDIDKKAMMTIMNGLDDLYPTSLQVNKALQKSLKKSAKPIQAALKTLIKTNASKTASYRRKLGYKVGKLKRSIRIWPSQKNTKYGRPSVYVGPIVKTPKSIRKKKGINEVERRQLAIEYAKKKSGFYFYMLEYGFAPKGGTTKINGLGLLPKAAQQGGSAALNRLQKDILTTLNKRSIKLLGVNLK